MKTWRVSLLIAVLLVPTLFLGGDVLAQAAKGKWPVAITGTPSGQNSLKVDNSTTPNRVEVGCETAQESPLTVNGLRVVGSATGANPSLTAIPCTGGDTNIGITLTPAGTGQVTLGGTAAPLISTAVTTNVIFFPANQFCTSDNQTVKLIPTRVASNDWALAVTDSAGSTQNIHCTIPLPYRSTASKGVKIDGISISYFIGTNALTSHTFNALSTTTYANATANSVAAYGGTVTCGIATATQATPYLTACSIGTAAYMNTASTQVGIDFTAVLAASATTYRFYGIYVTYSTAPY